MDSVEVIWPEIGSQFESLKWEVVRNGVKRKTDWMTCEAGVLTLWGNLSWNKKASESGQKTIRSLYESANCSSRRLKAKSCCPVRRSKGYELQDATDQYDPIHKYESAWKRWQGDGRQGLVTGALPNCKMAVYQCIAIAGAYKRISKSPKTFSRFHDSKITELIFFFSKKGFFFLREKLVGSRCRFSCWWDAVLWNQVW